MKFKEKINEFKEAHPNVTKVASVTAQVAIGATIGAGVYAASKAGVRIEVSTFATRKNDEVKLGDARELFNAALGIEAKGFDAAKTWERCHAIVDPYIGKAS